MGWLKEEDEVDMMVERADKAVLVAKALMQKATKDAKTMMISTKSVRKQQMLEDAAYTGVAQAILTMVEQVLPDAKADTRAEGSSLTDQEIESLKLTMMSKFVKELVENAEKIKEI